MARPNSSLVWIAGDRLVRADFGRGAAPLSVLEQPRPATDELGLLVDAALRMGGPHGRKVWVLSSDVWLQRALLPRASCEGMSAPQLSAALAFEAEPLSGIVALEASVAFRELESDDPLNRAFLMASARQQELASCAELVSRLGAQLIGVGHPAGLPADLGRDGARWRRLELWHDLALELRADGDSLSVELEHGSPLRLADLPERLERAGDDLLASRGSLVPDGVVTLEADDLRDRWLAAWQAALRGRTRCAVVEPPRPDTSAIVRVAAAGLLWAGVAFGCWLHWSSLPKKPKRAASPTDGGVIARDLASARRRLAALEPQIAAVAPARLQSCRDRASVLLDEIGRAIPRGVMVEALSFDGKQAKLSGVATAPGRANQLATALARALSDWTVSSPDKEREGKHALCRWSLTLTARAGAMERDHE